MQRFFLTTAAALALSTGAALAQSPDPTATPVAPAIQAAAASAYSGYYMVMSFRMTARRRTSSRWRTVRSRRNRDMASSLTSICIRRPRATIAAARLTRCGGR